MRRLVAVPALCAAVAGCGVSKDLYQSQVVRGEELRARSSDLEARLAAEAARRETLEKEGARREAEIARLNEELRKANAVVQEQEGRIGACSGREVALLADLDLCRKARSAADSDRDAERTARGEERRKLEAEVSACRGETARLEARARELDEERQRLEREKREKLDEISRTYEGLLTGMKDEVEKGRVTISQLRGRLSVNLLDEILFDSGSAEVKPEGRDVLDRVGEVLKGLEDKAIAIEGHTDDIPISGELAKRFPTNWELSTARATSVVRYLQESAGLPPERLSAVGFGPYRPLGPNDTAEGRARNRRIEIKLVPIESPAPPVPEEAARGTEPVPAGETSQSGGSQ